jgi:hypothetical protein
MAKRWNPPRVVADQELLGRRIFDDPIFRGALDQGCPGRLRTDHFEETRQGTSVSLDRLGRSNAEPRVLTYLRPRCLRAAEKFSKPKAFEGWAGLRAKDIRECRSCDLDVEASPDIQEGRCDLENNIYHTNVIAPPGAEKLRIELLVALVLKDLCERRGLVVPPPAE